MNKLSMNILDFLETTESIELLDRYLHPVSITFEWEKHQFEIVFFSIFHFKEDYSVREEIKANQRSTPNLEISGRSSSSTTPHHEPARLSPSTLAKELVPTLTNLLNINCSDPVESSFRKTIENDSSNLEADAIHSSRPSSDAPSRASNKSFSNRLGLPTLNTPNLVKTSDQNSSIPLQFSPKSNGKSSSKFNNEPIQSQAENRSVPSLLTMRCKLMFISLSLSFSISFEHRTIISLPYRSDWIATNSIRCHHWCHRFCCIKCFLLLSTSSR